MLHLKQSEINKMYLVCDDILTIENPVYLFRFINVQTVKEDLIELVNELPSNPRGDLFSLELPTQLDLETGYYSYYIYESVNSGDNNFESMPLLASGKMEVKTIFENDTIYENSGEDIVYKGDES